MTFGKNRVQTREFTWNYYRFDRYDIYFYTNGEDLAKFTAETAEVRLAEIENLFGYYLQKRIIFVIYNRLSDFKQSNIGLVTGNEEYNTGGVMKIIDNKVFLYFDGNHEKFVNQIANAIAEVVFTEFIYGGNMREKLAASTLLNIPDWYTKGLFSYIADNWNVEIENRVKDGILNDRFSRFNRLSGEDAVYAGHSLWNYIAEIYGKTVIPNIVYMTKVNKNVDGGFLIVLGVSLKEITPAWIEFYRSRFEKDTIGKQIPKEKKLVKRPKKNRVYRNVKISPNGKFVAYTTNELGKYKVWLQNIETGKRKVIYKREFKLEQITDYSFPVLAWHPNSNILSFITEEKSQIFLTNYFIDSKEKTKRLMLYFEKILDFSYSHDGQKLVMSTVQNGQVDIFVHTLLSATNERITQDMADDFNPRFVDNSRQIVFSSNRLSDTLRFEKYVHAPTARTFDLYSYNYYNKSKKLMRITETPYINESFPQEMRSNIYTFLSDENGIMNRHIAKFDSTISYIDTTTHYRFYINKYPITNYPINILDYDINAKNMTYSEVLFWNGRNELYHDQLNTKRDALLGEFKNTNFRKNQIQNYIQEDSLKKLENTKKTEKIIQKNAVKPVKPEIIDPDSMIIDIYNYVFEKEKYSNLSAEDNFKLVEKEDKSAKTFKLPAKQFYTTTFFTNYFVNQIDFGFLNTSYQAFTNSAVYFTPGFNVLFKIGTNDLFEDYKITGGMRLSGDFDSNEYLLSYEDLKHRWDKQVIFHRQAYKSDAGGYTAKTTSQELIYLLKFPFSQVSSLRGSVSLRSDHLVLLSQDYPSLIENDLYRNWAGTKLEYIFDNSRNLGLNLYEGIRSKAWIEAYKEVGKDKSDLFVVGGDFRYYIKLHRTLIWANRFAASTSFGQARLIYYLGGVDNWINYSGDVEIFANTPINHQQKYAYQTVGTNMRGFLQNVRNGNSFAVINSELRWPIVRYFANRPLNSDFLNNLQFIGFSDVGTAFCGPSPLSKENEYNKTVISQYPVTVTVDNKKSALVAGYGFGIRSRLLGYFLRADWSWGIDSGEVLPRQFYLSLSLDF